MTMHHNESNATALGSSASGETVGLDDLLDQISEEIQQGKSIDSDRLLADYPQYAEQLKKLLPTMTAMATFGKSTRTESEIQNEHRGRTLGDFRIRRQVGRGGMGVVYEAEQISLGRKVALKVLPFAAVLDEKQIKRFKNEARAAATLDHPHIVPVYSIGEERGVYYYAMAFVDGQTVGELVVDLKDVHEVPRLPDDRENANEDKFAETVVPEKHTDIQPAVTVRATATTEQSTNKSPEHVRLTVRLGIEASEALHHAHEHGVIHRDIKPGNLLVDFKGKLFIADFGLARLESDASMTMSGDLLGTIRYMSPEQALAKRIGIDHRTDIYSLGVTLYELLTLQPVFVGNDRQDLLRQIAFTEPKPPRQLNPAIPRDLETIVLKAISKDPTDRYDSAEELAEDLKRFSEDKAIQARRPTLLEQGIRILRKHFALVTTTAAVAIVSLISIVIVASVKQTETSAALQEAESQAVRALVMAVRAENAEKATIDMLAREKEARRIADSHRIRAEQNERAVLSREATIRTQLYATDMHLAYSAYQAGAAQDTLQRLQRHIPQSGHADLRDFAWNFLWDLCHDNVEANCRHQQAVYDIAYSHDGSLMATGGADNSVKITELPSGRVFCELREFSGVVNGIAFSPDGTQLATAEENRLVRIWDLTSGEERSRLSGFEQPVAKVWFVDNGARLVSTEVDWKSNEGTTSVWDLKSGRKEKSVSNSRGLAVDLVSKRLIGVEVGYQMSSWTLPEMEQESAWIAHENPTLCAATSPDGDWVVSGCKNGRIIVRHRGYSTTRELRPAHSGPIRQVRFTPNSEMFVTASDDGTVKVWDVMAGSLQKVFNLEDRVWTVEVAADGQSISAGIENGVVKTWKVSQNSMSRRRVMSMPRNISVAALEPNSGQVSLAKRGTASDQIIFYEIDGEGNLPEFHAPNVTRISSLQYSPDGGSLWAASETGKIYEIDHNQGEVLQVLDLFREGGYPKIRLSPNGRLISAASISSTPYFQIWDTSLERAIYRQQEVPLDPSSAEGVGVFLTDTQILGGIRERMHIWSIDRNIDRTEAFQASGWVLAKAISPQGDVIATGTDSSQIQLWKADDFEQISTLVGHIGNVTQLAFSPDGVILASASDQREIKIWHVPTRQLLFDLSGFPGHIPLLQFTANGQCLVAVGGLKDGHGEVVHWGRSTFPIE